MTDTKALLAAAESARDFPDNTCTASRHVHLMAHTLATGERYPMLDEDPAYCAESMLAVVTALWRARTELMAKREPLTDDEIDALWKRSIAAACDGEEDSPHLHFARAVIAADRAQRERQEPVAWGILNTRPFARHPLMQVMLTEPAPSPQVVPLYLDPPQREPLTDTQIKGLWYETKSIVGFYTFRELVRAIERAHGIGTGAKDD